ncbi:alpha/beta hydrolase [Niveibacterium umoris]|uniref:Non-heme chloroperoxidase n=1 Tax=Niveibacterium umoris TaxID=1193620 RepID=A0A840BM89_9RHOO|nr:alpha/beta fold hydrolase [Niveibacterium umoris]MBB4013753.1 non-heme chloroperoxidase [Niveibacterium umoris]
MNARSPLGLELLSALPQGKAHATPLLFVHGAHAGAWCWQEHFLPFFAEHGWAAHALSLSGHGASPGREYLDALSIDDYVRDLREAIATLPAPPVLIGHSMGGFVVQKLLEKQAAPALVLMCAVPPGGMWTSALGLAIRRPGLVFGLNRLAGGGQIGVHELVEAMFHQPLPPDLLERYFRRMHGESQRAIWDMLGFALPHPRREHCKHVMVMGAAEDALIATAGVRQTASSWGVEPLIVPGIGHGMMLEPGWRAAAEPILHWLDSLAL